MSKRKRLILTILFAIASAVGLFVLITFLVAFFLGGFKLRLELINVQLLLRKEIWLLWGAAIIAIVVMAILNLKVHSGKNVAKHNEGEDSKWLTTADIKANPSLTITKLSELENVDDGIPIYAEKGKHKSDVSIVLAKPIHTLAVGTTGSGKTTGFIDPFIQIVSRCKTKPGMVITDPKGELYAHHGKSLVELGYKVQLIDINDLYASDKWNPFNDVLNKTEKINTVINSTVESKRGRYYYGDNEYLTYEEAEHAKAIVDQRLNDEIFSDIQDIIYTICPIENKHDSTWQKGARDLILALALAFWEDVRDGLMTRKQFNLYNLYKNISVYIDNECAEFKAYFANRSKFSKTKGLANTVLISEARTLTSYLGDVNQYFSWMSDNGIAALTSENEVELGAFDEEPKALFLRIPDHKENRHKLVKLFLMQMYKSLVDKADRNEHEGLTQGAELLRNVYFILDEFVNMPKIETAGTMMRVGRSRRIFLVPVIQDYASLDAKYSKEEATSIRSNCNIKIFIGTTDLQTAEEYSKLCGKHKVRSVSYSEQKDVSVSSQAQERPLIYASELMKLNDPPHKMGNAIVIGFGKNALRARFTPVFKAREVYSMPEGVLAEASAELFQEEDYFYDIKKRNAFVEEELALEEEQQAMMQSMVNQLKNTNETTTELTAAERMEELIVSKINALRGRVVNAAIDRLLSTDIAKRLTVIDWLMSEAVKQRNNFLMFDLAKLKTMIETQIDELFKEEVEDEKVNKIK